jgi:hypothetical protein
MTTRTAFPNGLSVENGVHLAANATITKKVGAVFAGGTTNAHGDFDGTGNPYSLFTVTGVVEMRIFGICNTDLAGATATLEVGVASNTAALIAQTTATEIDQNEIWLSNSPGLRAQAFGGQTFIVHAATIIETAGTANITAGQIDYYCLWRPISDGATVVAA